MAIVNLTNCSNPKLYQSSINLESYLVIVLTLFVFVFGFILNLIILVLIIKVKNLKTVPNLLLANLAVADISYLFGHVLTNIPNLFMSTFVGGSFICKLHIFTRYATLGGSIFTLTIMAVDRFTAIVLPMNHQLSFWRSKKFVSIVIASIWLVASIISLPVVIKTKIQKLTIPLNKSCITTTLCGFDVSLTLKSKRALMWIQFTLYFILPFAIICVCYLTIALKLDNQDCSGSVRMGTSRSISQRKKLSKIVLGFIITFLLCRLPDQIKIIIFHTNQYSHYYLVVTAQVSALIHPILNPLTLLMLSALFRHNVLKLFHCGHYEIQMNTMSYVPKSKIYCNASHKRPGSTLISEGKLHIEEKNSCL